MDMGLTMNDTVRWFSRAKAEADKGIPRHERVVGIAIVTFSVLMILYFGSHQIQSTGFFTSKFGTMEMLMLYGFWVFWITTAGLEGVLGRRLLSRGSIRPDRTRRRPRSREPRRP